MHKFISLVNVIFWFMCIVADSGRYNIPGNSKQHRSRLLEGERILQRFEDHPNSLQVVNDILLQFKILSTQTPNQWYQVSLQGNYCDCPDWSSECKHLYGIRLIVMRHFPHLSTILPTVDNAHHMFSPTSTDMFEAPKGEEVMTCIHELKEVLSSLEHGIANKGPKELEVILHQLQLSKDLLGSLVSPTQIHMPAHGSVRQIQAHVTQTRLGHGMPKVQDDVQEQDIQQSSTKHPEKPLNQTGSLKRKHQRGRNRVRFTKWPRIWCPHCCSKTLLVDPKVIFSCQTCHALLPLALKHCSPGDEASLLGKEFHACGINSYYGRIQSCEYGKSKDEERSFLLSDLQGNNLQVIFASHVRILLMYYNSFEC